MAEVPSFLSNLQAQSVATDAQPQRQPQIDLATLNDSQRRVYRVIRDRRATDDQLLAIISGGAGTGKSYLIQAIKELMGDKCLLTAPTGVAAFNISGETIHSALGLQCKLALAEMSSSGPALQKLQDKFAGVELLVIDEYSMVGKRMLATVEKRLRQAVPASSLPFGGLSVLLVGDICQLPPVMDQLLYTASNMRTSIYATRHGFLCYGMFTTVFLLETSMRQVSHYFISSLQIKISICSQHTVCFESLLKRYINSLNR